jgi:tRNA(Ile)-lysidine synthase
MYIASVQLPPDFSAMDVMATIRKQMDLLQVPVDASILLGVSGGLDSMVLLHALDVSGYAITAAHVNFQLRGEESDLDEAHVLSWCAEHDIPCLVMREDTNAYADTNGINIQQAARRIRYDWWESLLSTGDYDFVVTAHHQDDNIETIVMNFMRGTGIKGLIGIPAKRYQIIRPMLPLTRDEIHAYALAHSVSYREDSSNELNYYLRNRVRNQLIPYLQNMLPGFKERIKHTAMRTTLEWKAWDRMYWDWVNTSITQADDGYDIVMRKDDEGILLRWLEMKGMPWPLAYDYVMAEKHTGEPLYYMDYLLSRTPKGFFLRKAHERFPGIQITEPGVYHIPHFEFSIAKVPATSFTPDPSKDVEFVSADVIRFPLSLRMLRKGDVFQPLGMQGKSKKLQDLLVDRKFAVHEKQEVWVLANPDHIIWVAGVHLDERAKVLPGDAEIFKLTFKRG